MDEEELKLLEKYKRLCPGTRHIALVQIAALAEFEENHRKQSDLLQTASADQCERSSGLSVRLR
ncbi:hypothetical protein ACYULU_07545 [Breznakiellaceae bacterium SP9]